MGKQEASEARGPEEGGTGAALRHGIRPPGAAPPARLPCLGQAGPPAQCPGIPSIPKPANNKGSFVAFQNKLGNF